MIRFIACIFTLLLIVSPSLGSDFETYLKNGSEQFSKGNYKEALSNFNMVNASRLTSPELLYNIGTCYLNLGENTKAILHLEKAQKHLPFDKSIAKNLSLSYDALGYPELYREKTFGRNLGLVIAYGSFSKRFAFIGLVFLWFFGIFLGMYLLGKNALIRRIGKISFPIALVIGIVFILLDHRGKVLRESTNRALLMNEVTILRESPQLGSQGYSKLVGGTQVKIDSRQGEWVKIRIDGERVGFILLEELELI